MEASRANPSMAPESIELAETKTSQIIREQEDDYQTSGNTWIRAQNHERAGPSNDPAMPKARPNSNDRRPIQENDPQNVRLRPTKPAGQPEFNSKFPKRTKKKWRFFEMPTGPYVPLLASPTAHLQSRVPKADEARMEDIEWDLHQHVASNDSSSCAQNVTKKPPARSRRAVPPGWEGKGLWSEEKLDEVMRTKVVDAEIIAAIKQKQEMEKNLDRRNQLLFIFQFSSFS